MSTLREHTELPQQVKSLIEARTVEAVFVVDPEYRIVHWDARAESLTGLLAEEMVGKPCYEALQGECEGGANPFSAQVCSLMRLAHDGQPVPGYEMRLFTRSGGSEWLT
ncbi:MAG TPA: PAS domain-containing protein [Rubrobacteraceae bacterium]